jgi:hypothetical protein
MNHKHKNRRPEERKKFPLFAKLYSAIKIDRGKKKKGLKKGTRERLQRIKGTRASSKMMRVVVLAALISASTAFNGVGNGVVFTSKAASLKAGLRPSLRTSHVIGPKMFNSKIFEKSTYDFSVAPDPTTEDILKVSI